jgi:hypothetical protein
MENIQNKSHGDVKSKEMGGAVRKMRRYGETFFESIFEFEENLWGRRQKNAMRQDV